MKNFKKISSRGDVDMDKLLSDTEKLGFFESNLNQFEFITNDTFTIEDHYWETIEENKEKKTSYEFTEKD